MSMTQLPLIGEWATLAFNCQNPTLNGSTFKPASYARSVNKNTTALNEAGNPESEHSQNLALFQNLNNVISLSPEVDANFYLNRGYSILITPEGNLPDIRIYTPEDFQYYEVLGDALTL